MGQEGREHPRFEIDAFVDYTGTEVALNHRVQNISMGGVCIQSAAVEPIGTIVDLVVNFPDMDAAVAARGEVVWCNREAPMDMGVRFIDLDEERKDTLRRYLDRVRAKK